MIHFEIANGNLWFVGGLIIIAISCIIWIRCKNIALLKTVTDLHRGTQSERRLVLKLLKHKIPASTIFHDLYVQKPNGTPAKYASKIGVVNALHDAVLNGEDEEIRAQHIRSAQYATRGR